MSVPRRPPNAVVHRAESLLLRLREIAELLVDEHAEVADDRRERGRELVRDVAVELGAELLDLAEALVRGGQLGDLLFEVGHDAARLDAQAIALLVRRRHHPLAAPADVPRDLLREVPCVDRLLEEAVAADGEARLAIAFGGDRDDRHAVERGLGAEAQRDLEAVEAGNIQIDEDDVRTLRDRKSNSLEPVGRVDDLVSVARQQLSDEQPVPRVILDVQNARQVAPNLAQHLREHVPHATFTPRRV